MTEDEIKEEMYQDMKADAYAEKAREVEEAKLDWELENNYDFFCEHFSAEFDEAIYVINELKKLHDKYNHQLLAEDLL